MDLIDVTSARHLGGHRLWLRFEDGVEGEVDLSRSLRGPVFEPLRDPAFFAKFFIDLGTVNWPNGADFAQQALYRRVKAAARTRTGEAKPRRRSSRARRGARAV